MRAGTMTYYLTLLRLDTERDAYGAEHATYTVVKTVHAERVKLAGRRSEEVGEHFPDYDAQFRIRDAHHVEENWRCRQRGGELYTIVAIEPSRDKGMLTLICQRVNE